MYDADCYVNPDSIDYSQLSAKYPDYLKSFKDKDNSVWKEVKRTIKVYNPDVVGISTFTAFAASAFFIAKITKELCPKAKVVMGGPHATVKADEILRICPEVDYVVSGEGEETIRELIKYLQTKKLSLNLILGLSYRKAGLIVHNQMRPLLRDVDKDSVPDRSILINEKKYSSEDMGLIMTSRGCPYHCTYCASRKGISYRSIDNVMKEIVLVKKKYGTTQFTFKDDSFTVDKNRVRQLCEELIKNELKIKWECNTRVDLINEELLLIMKKAGCNFIKVGIESGSARILKKTMNKGITLDQSRRAARLFNKVGIHWTGYFMMGVNGETVSDIYKTLKFMKELKPNLALIGVYEPMPGTVMFSEGIKRGLIKENMTLEDFYSTSPNDYYKLNPNVQSDAIPPEEFLELQEKINMAFRSYNMKIGNVWTMGVSKINVYLKEPKILLEDVKKFYKYIFVGRKEKIQ